MREGCAGKLILRASYTWCTSEWYWHTCVTPSFSSPFFLPPEVETSLNLDPTLLDDTTPTSDLPATPYPLLPLTSYLKANPQIYNLPF